MANPQGSWQLLPYESPILPVHAALLHTGTPENPQVFFYAGSGNDPDNVGTPNGSAVWDVQAGSFFQPDTPLNEYGDPIDIFCAGQSFLSDGKLIVAGGTGYYDPFTGLLDTLLLDPSTKNWTPIQPMVYGRWYPTLVTLGNGKVLAVSGFDENGGLCVNPEIYSASTGWSAYTQESSPFGLYAHLFLLNNGKVFYSGGNAFGNYGVTPRILTLPANPTQPIAEREVPGLGELDSRDQCTSVMLPPAQNQQVMIMGGGLDGTATKSTYRVTLTATSTPPRSSTIERTKSSQVPGLCNSPKDIGLDGKPCGGRKTTSERNGES